MGVWQGERMKQAKERRKENQGREKRLGSLEPKQLCAIIISAAVDQWAPFCPSCKEEPAINTRIISH